MLEYYYSISEPLKIIVQYTLLMRSAGLKDQSTHDISKRIYDRNENSSLVSDPDKEIG